MSNYYFQYDTTSGVIYPYLQASVPASSAQIGVLGPYPQDTAPSQIVMAYTYPQRFLAQGSPVALVEQPYFSVSVVKSATIANQLAITATLQNPPSTPPTSATFTVCGQAFTEAITNGAATLTLNIHPSLAGQQVQISVGATGCVAGLTTIGSTVAQVGLQVYTPSGGMPTVTPTSNSYLAEYWSGTATPPQFTLADVATITGILANVLLGKVIPTLTSGTTPLLTLDANEKNAVADLTALLQYIPTTLEEIAPKPVSGQPQVYDMHYKQYRADIQTTKSAMQSYASDVATIPNLTA